MKISVAKSLALIEKNDIEQRIIAEKETKKLEEKNRVTNEIKKEKMDLDDELIQYYGCIKTDLRLKKVMKTEN